MKAFTFLGAVLAICHIARPTRACGPDFPNSYLSYSAGDLISLPTLTFATELGRLPRLEGADGAAPLYQSDNYDSAAGELAEARAALAAAGLAGPALEAAAKAYDRHAPARVFPAEFHLYAAGAEAWASGNPVAAVQAWRALLALPAAQRRYRTTWAEYMLGRALYVEQPAEARALFARLRREAGNGAPDSQRLAVASLGWEGRSYLDQGDYPAALRLYLRQFQAGDPTALPSLQRVVRYAFVGEERSGDGNRASTEPAAANRRTDTDGAAPVCRDLSELAADAQTRAIVTAWFVSQGGPHASWGPEDTARFKSWIAALRRTKDLSPEEAERWAFASYQAALWDDAQRFVQLAPPDDGAGEWVWAMLLLRHGFVDEAARHLANAAKHFPAAYRSAPADPESDGETPWERLAAAQGALALRRDQFVDALRIFYVSGHWTDAAFVAEQILTLDELEAFVRVEAPPSAVVAPAEGVHVPDNLAGTLRALLARRLVRAHRFDAAREYFPAETRAYYDPYLAETRQGFDASRSAADRAHALWAAAQIIHEHGMEIMGTELTPDYAIWDGSFESPDFWTTRYHEIAPNPFEPGGFTRTPEGEAAVLAPTDAELKRAFSHLPPKQRFHYRARASELAWLAAGLLPNDDDRTAEILDTAGRWLARRSPEEADLFYKSLATRCPHTDLGRRVIQRRWFDPARPEALRSAGRGARPALTSSPGTPPSPLS